MTEADVPSDAAGLVEEAISALKETAATLLGPVPEGVWLARAWTEPLGPSSLRQVLAAYCLELAEGLQAGQIDWEWPPDQGLGRYMQEWVDPRRTDPFHEAVNRAGERLDAVWSHLHPDR